MDLTRGPRASSGVGLKNRLSNELAYWPPFIRLTQVCQSTPEATQA